MKSTGFREIVAHDCYHICFPKSCCVGKHAWLVVLVDGWVKTNLTLTMWAKQWSELPVAMSLGDALYISEVRLPGQPVMV